MSNSSRRQIKTAVFPVAGLGSRFLPATKAIPKEMLVVVDKPLIQYAVEEARDAGIERFIFVTSQGKSSIEDHFDRSPNLEKVLQDRNKNTELARLKALELNSGQAVFVRQHSPLGLGHAVWCARHLVGNEPFALILPDDLILSKKPCLKQMIDNYSENDANMVAVMNVERENVNRYGILDTTSNLSEVKIKANGVVEKPLVENAPSTTAIIGRYILHPQIFEYLGQQKPGINGEIQLTDAIQSMIQTHPLYGFRYEGQRYDCGTKEGWLEANFAFAYAEPELREHMIRVLNKYHSS